MYVALSAFHSVNKSIYLNVFINSNSMLSKTKLTYQIRFSSVIIHKFRQHFKIHCLCLLRLIRKPLNKQYGSLLQPISTSNPIIETPNNQSADLIVMNLESLCTKGNINIRLMTLFLMETHHTFFT